jgi:diguanylate cyclase (GGDEF)-like protein
VISRLCTTACATVLLLSALASPAGAAGLGDLLPPGNSQGNGRSENSPLDSLLNPVTGLLPGNENQDDPIGGLLPPSDNQTETPSVTPASEGEASTPKPQRAPPTTTARKPPTHRPVAAVNKAAKSSRGPSQPSRWIAAEPVGHAGGTSSSAGTSRKRSPKRVLAVNGPPAPDSFAGKVVNQIPSQYRWPVFVLACLAMLFAFTSLRERRRSLRVERAALVDSLTGLPNRAAFERRLAKEWRRSERYDRPLGMLLIDLNDFKHVNDTQGHAAGDAVLREVAAAISGRIRLSDMAARLGGDEFVVICPETALAGLESLAHSLDERLEQTSIKVSIGFTEREPADENPDAFVHRADAAMYRRKQQVRSNKARRAHRLVVPQPLTAAAD